MEIFVWVLKENNFESNFLSCVNDKNNIFNNKMPQIISAWSKTLLRGNAKTTRDTGNTTSNMWIKGVQLFWWGVLVFIIKIIWKENLKHIYEVELKTKSFWW